MKYLKTLAAATFGLVVGSAALAGDWPKGPVQLLIPAKAGGGSDVMGRVFADYLQSQIGKPVVVVNQPAGGGTVAFETVRNATPDGQTLIFTHTGLLVNYHTGRYDHPLSEFTTIAIGQSYPPQVYAVAPDAPWSDMKDFVEDARAHPGEYTFGVALGGTSHFIAGQIMDAEDVAFKLVEASSEVDKVAALQGGHIDIGNMGAGAAAQYVEAGKLKVLAMIDAEADPKYPDFVPALDQGVNASWVAPLVLWGPAGMDPALVEEINAAVKGMAENDEVIEQLDKMSSKVRAYDVAEAQALIAAEDAKIGTLAQDLGLARK
ncbi:Bug family tripartite tricarboxylate transporter substrate binding protein [Salipiger mangrovisoli]|uniref:Tripartite tricarboxylate transporter substrate binding protein n=1 Tax=Salipiger mangrovisoli TaxID=2865933 RepID=A0ABR9X4C2_9RHOB|nr:tripartite tricarboxylate transporter substrate binding protein [Salipiger mangrovisoli]MBE9638356.1 tripartite tricarboxylate transporter substrate binding protein [Salipiger mangrovisoli]